MNSYMSYDLTDILTAPLSRKFSVQSKCTLFVLFTKLNHTHVFTIFATMADSASELESDTSSIDGGPTTKASTSSHIEQLNNRVESLQQENRVLKVELETYKLKCKTLMEEKRELQRASVNIVSCSVICCRFVL